MDGCGRINLSQKFTQMINLKTQFEITIRYINMYVNDNINFLNNRSYQKNMAGARTSQGIHSIHIEGPVHNKRLYQEDHTYT